VSTVYIRFPAPPADREPTSALCRAPLLEGLLARADSSAESETWRADAFRVLSAEPLPAIGPVGLCAAQVGSAAGCACVYVATPVHYAATMTDVRMPPTGVLSLPAGAAAGLADDFNRVFAEGGQALHAARDGALYCTLAQEVVATTADPARALGRDIGAWLPTGAQGARLRRLMSEIEMWLFDHALNRRRLAAGEPPISGLWLWGGGPPIDALPQLRGWVAGRDALFSAWSGEVANAVDVAGAVDAAWAADPREGPGVAVLAEVPGSSDWNSVEARWILPAVRRLRANGQASVVLSAGMRRYSLSGRSRWRWWRRPRPWWEYFA
jgi:hypothetical protein